MHTQESSAQTKGFRYVANPADAAANEDTLNTEVPRKLEAVDPRSSKFPVLIRPITGEFVSASVPRPYVSCLHLVSGAINKNSTDILDCGKTFTFEDFMSGANVSTTKSYSNDENETNDGDAKTSAPSRQKIKVHNDFNFCAIETMTKIRGEISHRTAETATEPPPTQEFSEFISASIIYQAYTKDYEGNLMKRQINKPREITKSEKNDDGTVGIVKTKLAERVVGQNIFDKISFDFRYFEDPADEFRSEGRLLPLWRFRIKDKILPVTDMAWNPDYYDLLAVTFGCGVDETIEGICGALVLFSLKNPLDVEYIRTTHVGAACVALHPNKSRLAAVGLSDGNVSVYDTSSSQLSPEYTSDSSNKHMISVQAAYWKNGPEPFEFLTISGDGYVKNWVLMRTRLEATIIRVLSIPFNVNEALDVSLNARAFGFCFAFHPKDENVYLVGDMMGYIMKCSSLQTNDCVFVYKGHNLSVHRIEYSPFMPDIFLSCSADWTINLWEDERPEPLLQFNLGYQVMDLKWAPYTSTVFAACSADGNVHVFDLDVNRYGAIYIQRVVSRRVANKPTSLSFNNTTPLLVIGDIRGTVRFFKLSPNLRRLAKASKKETLNQQELELRKLQRVLALMRPKDLKLPLDVPCISI